MKLNRLVLAGFLSSLALTGCSPKTAENSATIQSTGDGIIGGSEVQSGDRIQTSIVAVYDTASGALCTGSLLTNNLVLTAAHCIGDDVTKMLIFFDNKLGKQSYRLQVDQAEVSPYWASRQNENVNTGDIALIHFVGDVPDGWKPATFANNAGRSQLANGAIVVLAGYGITNGVTHEGAGVLRVTTVKIDNAQFSASEITINQTMGQGACHGDSGGPAYIQINGKYYLWGVTSRGIDDPSNDCTKFSAYTNALFYKTWLNKAANKMLGRQ
ncbi:MAG: S1 family peptidase [Bdellovibrio sp.]